MVAGFSIVTLLLIMLAGIGAGFVGYAVGASSLVSYPALLALGIPPVLANASNTVGVIGTVIGGVVGAQHELKGQAARVAVYMAIGALGGVTGAFLLLELDEKVFEFAAPALILFSSLLIAANPRGRIQARAAAKNATAQLAGSAEQPVQPMRRDAWWVWPATAGVAVYSGYFGAGAGTVSLAVLGVVDWPAAIMLCAGCFIGGCIAPPVTRRISANAMRWAAVIAGVILTVDLAVKTYL